MLMGGMTCPRCGNWVLSDNHSKLVNGKLVPCR